MTDPWPDPETIAGPREYHVSRLKPNALWPGGSWAVYQIDGDRIAECVVRERINAKGYYEGAVIARHEWGGYLGMVETLEGVKALIETDLIQAGLIRAGLAKPRKQR